jgi:HAD superfamily hydrolase (TIGR01490 family)
MLDIVAFDLDKTLTNRDCLIPFLVYLRKNGQRLNARAGLRCFRLNRSALKRSACALLADLETQVVDTLAGQFVSTKGRSWLRPDVVSQLRNHQASGAKVVIVSASLSIYVKFFAELLGVDYRATTLEVTEGRFTGAIEGTNVRHHEKVTQLESWLAEMGVVRSDIHLTAYGDSSGDSQMMDWADSAVWVKYQRLRGWSPSQLGAVGRSHRLD